MQLSKNTFTFHVEEYITKNLENVFIKRQFNYESKYNAQVKDNKHFLYLNKRLDHKNDDPQQSNIVI
jgi:hypothetical protein